MMRGGTGAPERLACGEGSLMPQRLSAGHRRQARTLLGRLVVPAIVLIGICCSTSALADKVSLGVPEFPKDILYLESPQALALVVRSAVLETLLKPAAAQSGMPFSLRLAQNMASSADGKLFSLLIRDGTRFQDGRRISGEDVKYSLLRCRQKGMLNAVAEINVRTERAPYDTPPYRSRRCWVDLKLRDDGAAARNLPAQLMRCPIVEKSSMELFGADAGRGTNLVGSGLFRLKEYRSGRELTLQRAYVDATHGESSEIVNVRLVSDARQGLTALRVGTLDAMFTKDDEVEEKARGDETLIVRTCGEYHLILRRGFTLKCEDPLDLSDLRYVF